MKRRQFGSVRRLPSGRWQASYWHVGRRHVAEVTLLTKADANAYLAAMETQIRRGSWIDPWGGHVGFVEWAEEWKSTIVDLRPSTKARDVGYLERYVLPRFGTLELGRDRPHDGAGMGGRAQRLRPRPVDDDQGGPAPQQDHAGRRAGRLPPEVTVRRRAAPTDRAGGDALPRSRRGHGTGGCHGPALPAAVLLAAYGGLRAGELFGLRAKRVDPLRRSVTIAETVVDVGGHP